MNVLFYRRKIHNSNTKICANSIISFEPYSYMLFSKEARTIVLTKDYLLWDYIVNFTSTNMNTVPVVKAFKWVIDEKFANGISRDTLLRVADNFCTRAKLCMQEDDVAILNICSRKRSKPIDITKCSYL